MPDGAPVLDVRCFEEVAGRLVDAPGGLKFAYAPEWLIAGMPPLSQSLPLDGSFDVAAVAAFFGGLLPEGTPRDLLARRLGVSLGNDFGLLAAVGGDTAGAISLQPPGHVPSPSADGVEWLDEAALITLIDELPTRPMHADDEGEFRLSLAGVQDKLPVIVGKDGRIGLTKGQMPSTHILKTPIVGFDDTVANEAFSLALGRALDIRAVVATPHRVDGREFLVVQRYDRRGRDGTIRRLHQEDFCQALGIPADRKYQSEGGPSLADCFALLRRATAVPASEVLGLLDHVALSFLVGNHDAHGKNSSLLYLPDTADAVLAPAYDVLSTVAYHKSHNLTRKMAMDIGGEYRPDYVESRHLDRMLDDAGLGVAAARRRLRSQAAAAPAAAQGMRARLVADGWDKPVLERVVAIVVRRAARLAALASPQPRR